MTASALVGGLYGVRLGRAFFGESMFHVARDASKIALVHLVARMKASGYRLLDTQFLTDHLTTFGARRSAARALSPHARRRAAGRRGRDAFAPQPWSGAQALAAIRRMTSGGLKTAVAGIVAAASFALAMSSASLDHVNAQTTPGAVASPPADELVLRFAPPPATSVREQYIGATCLPDALAPICLDRAGRPQCAT